MPDESEPAEQRCSLPTFAARLIACEARTRQTEGSAAEDAFQICEKLRAPLATLMGGTGYRALLSRALTMARREHAWLRAVAVPAEGPLSLPADAAPAPPGTPAAGSAALISTLLGLLAAFIGHPLTLGLVRGVWPDFPPDDPEPGIGDTP
jgi:hypothetical protein